jgi:hemoglobin
MADAKTKAPDDTATCRACHLPLTDKDYIFRYDEYFQKRIK